MIPPGPGAGCATESGLPGSPGVAATASIQLTVEFDSEIGTRLRRNQMMMACIQENIAQVHLPEALVGVNWQVQHEIRIGIGMKGNPQSIAVLTTPRRFLTGRSAQIAVFPGRRRG